MSWDDDDYEDRISEEDQREDRESSIYNDLLEKKDPYRDASNERTIKINSEKYSPHWVLCYAQARNAGIACMYSSAFYAMERMYHSYHEDHGRTYIFSRATDAKLLWQAHLLTLAKKLKQGNARRPRAREEVAA